MSFDSHTVSAPAGAKPQLNDRAVLGSLIGVANVAGAGAGAAVTVAVTGLSLPPNYAVAVNPGQDATWFVSAKTQSGFTVTLNPRLAANTLTAGTIDVIITA
ncbi:hypothetical protein AQ938_06925 [Burkholderia pseudomallei]|uniref:hypothetical protein n=1 Tax=Burkholderia pseudomallei TaxID=28450 RepID=UPI000055B597|nr:hypothetical protein [Burkholderia pseudomallei]AJX59247.1 hypothetical protein DP47_3381 [Burkholderia pseudomallei Pasteur 52237]EDO95550.1 hypothetical protein BURPSPAST_C1345 [Burkholderia pseudomallei Pasteur 52237]MWA16579.1 hypothetical protein [Burkholderia pseudomallei]OND79005.1 hypothetical protein AQ938_06925 [Burkholderia pseudomallei]VBQ80968.1 Uncharacterised protein [Burkholderia pseudomallei]